MSATQEGRLRRNVPGAKESECFAWDALGDFEELTGQFAAQEYIEHHLRECPLDVDRLLQLPQAMDKSVWVLEHIRQILLQMNELVVRLDGVCTAQSCPKMMATPEWEFLCATHPKPQECCALDYCIHTMDGSTALINSTEHFPSRVRVPSQSVKLFGSMMRRLYRVFAHAFYHHRDEFDDCESKTALCKRFIRLVSDFELLPSRMLVPAIKLA